MSVAENLADAPRAPLRPGTSLPLARYRFTFRLQDELRLPEFAGSLLRGQFGASLRSIACMTGLPQCPPCPLYRTCPYPAIFETPPPETHALQRFSQVPNPYVIEPPPLGRRRLAAGDAISCQLVLVGRALSQLPLIAFAFQRAFERGIGQLRAKAELEDLAIEATNTQRILPEEALPSAPLPRFAPANGGEGLGVGGGGLSQTQLQNFDRSPPSPPTTAPAIATHSIWDAERSRIKPHEQSLILPALPDVRAITLKIVTPLRLQQQGHPVPPEKLKPRTLVTALLRRASLLFELHAGMPPVGADASRLAAAAEQLADERSLQWKDWKRFSSRQQREMTLGGVIGKWKLAGELHELLPWFWLGQWLHVGKETTMGLGRYSLEW